jgi:hypothetical protein
MLGGGRCRVNQLVRARPRAASPASIVGASRSIRGRVGRAAGKGLQEEFGGVGHLRERSCSRAAASQTSRSVHGAIEADRSREPVQETRSSLRSAPYASVSQFRQRATSPLTCAGAIGSPPGAGVVSRASCHHTPHYVFAKESQRDWGPHLKKRRRDQNGSYDRRKAIIIPMRPPAALNRRRLRRRRDTGK